MKIKRCLNEQWVYQLRPRYHCCDCYTSRCCKQMHSLQLYRLYLRYDSTGYVNYKSLDSTSRLARVSVDGIPVQIWPWPYDYRHRKSRGDNYWWMSITLLSYFFWHTSCTSIIVFTCASKLFRVKSRSLLRLGYRLSSPSYNGFVSHEIPER